MEESINYIKGLLDSGETPTQIRVNEPWLSAIQDSDIFTGESPLLPSADIVVSASPGEEHLIIFVGAGLHQAVVGF